VEDPRARLPSVTAILAMPQAEAAIAEHGREPYLAAVREALERARRATTDGAAPAERDEVHRDACALLEEAAVPALHAVINATGVVLHTNLGRAPLAREAALAMADAAGAVDVEFDLAEGRRAPRGRELSDRIARLCGAQAATIVNTGAAALVLAVAALARGREVVVSRGELVEIGGSFRLPDILVSAGAVLREVGTTNRTHLRDYEQALGERTGLVLRVHPSNYRVEGYAGRPAAGELAALAEAAGVPFVHDLGSGLLRAAPDLDPDEPAADTALREGADLVVFSGDKLLGGPQAGILAGRSELVDACRREPLARAMRVDKSRLAALEVTIELHRRGALTALPTWAMLRADPVELHERAERLAAACGGEVSAVQSTVGGGSFPGLRLPSSGVALPGPPDELARRLRLGEPPVVTRIVDDRVVIDLRTVAPARDEALAEAVRAARAEPPAGA
jgi:L-seryl-tRNA(Ser) seleniumtransferase